MSKQAYETGVVLIRCDGCQNNHLIADNLGWFGVDQRKRNIEWIMKHKGETVKRLTVYGSDSTEFVPKTGDIANDEEKIKQIDVKIAES
uniref:DNL-type domain-containing protein n=1 Tax=Bracon brevicornis TaxID=1563983 RepID=A0A6V7J7C2_9HYME